MSPNAPAPGTHRDEGEDQYALAKAALSRAKDTARNRGFRTRTGPRNQRIQHLNSEPGKRRDPAEVSSTLSRLKAMMGWRERLEVSSVLARWEEIVGEDVAAHCTVESFDDGELVIVADSTSWATQLRYLLPQIERRLAEEVGEGVVTKTHVRGPSGHRMRGKWRVQGRGARDTWG